MRIIDSIDSPKDLKKLDGDELEQLAAEIRQLLIEKVSVTGGHLGPNLGVVELSIALHYTFNSPQDAMVFDTSHQLSLIHI